MRRLLAFLALLLLPLSLLGKAPEGRSDLEGDWRFLTRVRPIPSPPGAWSFGWLA
jgi:hypothetical protein